MSRAQIAKRRETGTSTGAQISGARLPPPQTLLQESWRDFIFAEVWTRTGLDRRSRLLIAMASAANCNGSRRVLDQYVHGALASGELTLVELREAALHHAVYSGWSHGEALDDAISRVAGKLGLAAATNAPIRESDWDEDARTAEGMAEFRHVMTFSGPPSVTPYFGAGINNFVFGEMWRRPGLDQRARRWLTLVGVADSCADIPIASHFHAAIASGNCTAGELQEFVLQYAVHAGWPKASVIQAVVIQVSKKIEAGLPWDG